MKKGSQNLFLTNKIIVSFLLGLLFLKRFSVGLWSCVGGILFSFLIGYAIYWMIPASSVIFTKTFDIGLHNFLASNSTSTFYATLFLSIIGAGMGAWAGGYALHRSTQKSYQREALLKEIREANIALSLSFNNLNSITLFKEKYARPIIKEYEDLLPIITQRIAEKSHEPFKGESISGEIPSLPFLNTQDLNNRVLEHLNSGIRPISLIYSIEQTYIWLKQTLEERGRLFIELEEIRESKGIYPSMAKIFSLEQQYGDVDTSFFIMSKT